MSYTRATFIIISHIWAARDGQIREEEAKTTKSRYFLIPFVSAHKSATKSNWFSWPPYSLLFSFLSLTFSLPLSHSVRWHEDQTNEKRKEKNGHWNVEKTQFNSLTHVCVFQNELNQMATTTRWRPTQPHTHTGMRDFYWSKIISFGVHMPNHEHWTCQCNILFIKQNVIVGPQNHRRDTKAVVDGRVVCRRCYRCDYMFVRFHTEYIMFR